MDRRAFTLLELLVIISIVGLLVSLSMPAVQRAREAARRTHCLNNLHQCGQAIAAFEASHRVFPGPGGPWPRNWTFAPHAQMLSTLGYEPTYNSLNFSALPGSSENATAFATRISTFLCPSDPVTPSNGPRNNYRFNGGTGPYWIAWQKVPETRSGDGVIDLTNPKAPRDVVDGLSHTAMMSERVTGSGGPSFVPERDVSLLRQQFAAYTADQYYRACSERFGRPFTASGSHWLSGGPETTWYNHVATPNNTVPDCAYAPEQPRPGMFSARSWHSGGVNLLLADGSCRFVGERIDLAAWRALASRASGEVVDAF